MKTKKTADSGVSFAASTAKFRPEMRYDVVLSTIAFA